MSTDVKSMLVTARSLGKRAGRTKKQVAQDRLRERNQRGPLTVIAKFEGVCPQCHLVTVTGSVIVRRGGKWIHQTCESAAKADRVNLLYIWEQVSA